MPPTSLDSHTLAQLRLAETYFEHSVSCQVILDPHYNFVRVNKAYAQACRWAVEDLVGRNHFDIFPSDAKAIFDEVLRTRQPFITFTRDFEFPDQPERGVTYWDWTLVPVLDAEDEVQYLVFSLNEVTERKRAEMAIRQYAAEIEDLYDNAPCGYHSLDRYGCFVRVNQTELNWLGYTREELLGQPVSKILTPHSQQLFKSHFPEILKLGGVQGLEVEFVRKDGTLLPLLVNASAMTDAAGAFLMSRATVFDITERKRHQRELEYQANHDVLTGLPNRNLLRERIDQAIAAAEASGGMVGLMFLDLDRFKYVNDNLGHDQGDELLKAVAKRMRGTLRPGDTVARYGGDEFVVVLPALREAREAAAIAANVIQSMRQGFALDDQELVVTTSLGISLYPRDGTDLRTLLKCADMALYQAKDEGRNNYQFFAHGMLATVAERLRLERELRFALDRGQFRLCFQPQADLRTGQLVGTEALLRWQHPELGLVSPLRFIGLAEELGLIVPIGAWVLREACVRNKAWQDAGLPPIKVAVNLSARQFRQPDLVDSVRQTLVDTGLDACYLELELTESTLMENPDQVVEVLAQLSALGVALAIDDFGTGYSSLGYLKRFPIDKIKIDRSFVCDVTRNPDDAAIAKAIISIADDMKMAVIAEGVETLEQARFLRQSGCHHMQGFLFGRPAYPEDLEPLFHQGLRLGM